MLTGLGLRMCRKGLGISGGFWGVLLLTKLPKRMPCHAKLSAALSVEDDHVDFVQSCIQTFIVKAESLLLQGNKAVLFSYNAYRQVFAVGRSLPQITLFLVKEPTFEVPSMHAIF